MKPRQQVSRAAIELIKRFEGYRRTAAQLVDGRWTIGYSHTRTARKGAEVSEADAEALLIYDLMEVSSALNEWIYTPLTQNQFDALAAFVFNIGVENFHHSSVLRRLNEGALLQAACAMELWRKADFEGERIVIDALIRRRAAEKVLFLTPTAGFIPAPSQVLQPRVDHSGHSAVPAEAPVEVTTALDGDRAVAERASQSERVFEPAAPVQAEPELGSQTEPVPAPVITPIEPVPPDDEPTASEVASAAVTARLQAILSEPEDAAPEPGPSELDVPPAPEAPQIEPVAKPRTGFTLTPPPVDDSPTEFNLPPVAAAGPSGDTGQGEPELFTGEPMTFDDFDSRRVAHHDFDTMAELDQTAVEPIRSVGVVPALLGLLAVGLVVFSGALFWTLSTHSSAHGGFPSGLGLLGLALALIGVGCVATAVYFLLERLGGREEQ